jgi:anti-sigma B factor antagonist
VRAAGVDGIGGQLGDDQDRRVDAVECPRGAADGLIERLGAEPSRPGHGRCVAWEGLLALLAHSDSPLTLSEITRHCRACVHVVPRAARRTLDADRRDVTRAEAGQASDIVWPVHVETRPGADGRAVLHVSGEVDIQFAGELRDAGLAAAADSGLAINLAEVSFIDSTGLAALIEINNTIRLRGQALTLVAPSRSVRHILEVTGLEPVFAVIE